MTAATKKTYLIMGVVAAAVSAATTAYVVYSRVRNSQRASDSVEDLLDRCHDQVRLIEQRLGEAVA